MEENGRKYHGYKEGKYVLPVDEVTTSPPPLSDVLRANRLTPNSGNSTDKVGHSHTPRPWPFKTDPKTVFQYDLCLLTFDNHLSFAPFTKLNRVLDVGCGVGELGPG